MQSFGNALKPDRIKIMLSLAPALTLFMLYQSCAGKCPNFALQLNDAVIGALALFVSIYVVLALIESKITPKKK